MLHVTEEIVKLTGRGGGSPFVCFDVIGAEGPAADKGGKGSAGDGISDESLDEGGLLCPTPLACDVADGGSLSEELDETLEALDCGLSIGSIGSDAPFLEVLPSIQLSCMGVSPGVSSSSCRVFVGGD